MATTTPKLGLRKPADADMVDQALDLNANWDKLDTQFDPAAAGAHTHDGTNSKKVDHGNLTGLTTGDPHTQYVLKAQKGANDGVAPLDSGGKVPAVNLPAIDDAHIGNRTVDQAATGAANTGTLTQVLSWLAGRLKGITGKTNWFDAPATTLEAVNQHQLSTANPHQTTAAQVGAVKLAGDTMTGPLTLPGDPTSALQAATMQYVDNKGLAPNVVLASHIAANQDLSGKGFKAADTAAWAGRKFTSGTTAPAFPVAGDEWLDTSVTPNTLKWFDGTNWNNDRKYA